MSKAIVVLSGGQDSTTCLFLASLMFDEIHAITFNYGQKHSIEIEAAKKVAALTAVATHEIIEVPSILRSSSPLLSDNTLEKYDSYEEMDKIIGKRTELTFVSMRNTLFYTVAANRAVWLGADTIVTGICQSDNANYHDCTETYRAKMQALINESLGQPDNTIRLLAPLMYLSKQETIGLALRVQGAYEALAYTHTSYDGKYPPTDNNHSNVLRAHGFEEAGVPDPLVVRAWMEGLMELPNTPNYDRNSEIPGAILTALDRSIKQCDEYLKGQQL